MWRQWFPMEDKSMVERRKYVRKWDIIYTFPLVEQLTGQNMTAEGIFAFPPTEMVTIFSFIIQIDFLLFFFKRK